MLLNIFWKMVANRSSEYVLYRAKINPTYHKLGPYGLRQCARKDGIQYGEGSLLPL